MKVMKRTRVVLLALCYAGCSSWEYVGHKGGWGPNAGDKDIFWIEKEWSRGEYVPDRWEAEFQWKAGMITTDVFNHYERVRSTYPHKDIHVIGEGGNLWKPTIESGRGYHRVLSITVEMIKEK